MSQDNDKIKNDNNSVVNKTITNPINDESMIHDQVQINKTNTESSDTVLNDQHIHSGGVNYGITHETVPFVRQDMVLKAIKFLTHETVRNSPLGKKIDFLRKKGLTDEELQLSIKKASTIRNESQNSGPKTSVGHTNSSNYFGAVQTSSESQSWFKQVIGPIAFSAFIVYICYKMYIKYIKNWLFGMFKSPIEKSLEAVELSLQKCVTLLESKNKTDELLLNKFANHQKDLDQIHAEIKSLKIMLNNRSQFLNDVGCPSLPKWQITKKVISQKKQSE